MEDFIEKYQKVPVEEMPNNTPDEPLVSVCVQTYQHVNYIKQCLDGILMQKTKFAYEVLLGEDESNDGTRNICIEVAKKYPDKIKLFLHSRENNIKIAGRSTGRFNFLFNFSKARGKYIALCEGDDYWTDPYKLQKQVDFLEVNPDYGMCYTKCIYYYNNKHFVKKPWGGDNVSFDLLMNANCIPTLTVVLKLNLLKEYISDVNTSQLKWEVGDYPIWLWFAHNSKIKFINDVTGVYRVSTKSVSHFLNEDKKIGFTKSGIAIKKFYAKKYNLQITDSEFKRMEVSSELRTLAIYGNLPKFIKTWFFAIKQDFSNLFVISNYRYLIFFLNPLLRKTRL